MRGKLCWEPVRYPSTLTGSAARNREIPDLLDDGLEDGPWRSRDHRQMRIEPPIPRQELAGWRDGSGLEGPRVPGVTTTRRSLRARTLRGTLDARKNGLRNRSSLLQIIT